MKKLELEVPENIRSLLPYPPGKPIDETKREFGLSHVVKLASNENPLGPSPQVIAAIKLSLQELNLYPDGSHYELKKSLSTHLNIAMNEISIGCGSNEFIDLIPRIFIPKNRNLLTHKTAFVIYKLCSQLNGCQFIEVDVGDDLKVDVSKLLSEVNKDTRVVMIANPNNPTGVYLNRSEIDHLCSELQKRGVLLVLDYAYWEYIENPEIPDPVEVFKKYSNVAILRTFSKGYGLAGLRVGYCFARCEVISFIEKSRQPFNVTSTALIAAKSALEDREHLEKSLKLNREGKKELQTKLSKYGFKVFSGEGNFVLVDMKKPSQDLFTEFLKRGVIIRPIANYGLKTHFRISVGLDSEHKKLFSAIDEIFGAVK